MVELVSRPGISIKAAYEYLRHKYEKEGKEFNITYAGIRNHLWKMGIKPTNKAPKPHIRYETKPGEQLQVDWKEDLKMTTIRGEVLAFHIFTGTLGYSRLHTFIYSETKTTEDVIRCIIEALKQLGGVPRIILTDNMSSIVSYRGNRRVKNETIHQFEKDIGVQIKLCRPRSPQTKGKDESANRFINWLKPYDGQVADKEELIKIIRQINQRVNEQVNQTTNLPPITLFQKEKEYLSPLPNELLLESYIREVKTQVVPPTLLVRYKGAEYSVQKQFINKRVKIVPIEDKLYIYHNTQIAAIHTLSDQRINYDLSHYTEALRESLNEDEIEKKAIENLELLKGIGTTYE